VAGAITAAALDLSLTPLSAVGLLTRPQEEKTVSFFFVSDHSLNFQRALVGMERLAQNTLGRSVGCTWDGLIPESTYWPP
jgi:uncharacterized protein YjfI (DUF2170 family)